MTHIQNPSHTISVTTSPLHQSSYSSITQVSLSLTVDKNNGKIFKGEKERLQWVPHIDSNTHHHSAPLEPRRTFNMYNIVQSHVYFISRKSSASIYIYVHHTITTQKTYSNAKTHTFIYGMWYINTHTNQERIFAKYIQDKTIKRVPWCKKYEKKCLHSRKNNKHFKTFHVLFTVDQ